MTDTASTPATSSADNLERSDLLVALAKSRGFLRQTVNGLTDEQAAQRSTVSQLCLGGLIKHVSEVERTWRRFIEMGPDAFAPQNAGSEEDYANGFKMLKGETLAGLLAAYEDTARQTDDLVRRIDTLDASHPLPVAPWFEPGAVWSARRVVLHIVAETAQHSGHADILRETIDGAKTMG